VCVCACVCVHFCVCGAQVLCGHERRQCERRKSAKSVGERHRQVRARETHSKKDTQQERHTDECVEERYTARESHMKRDTHEERDT